MTLSRSCGRLFTSESALANRSAFAPAAFAARARSSSAERARAPGEIAFERPKAVVAERVEHRIRREIGCGGTRARREVALGGNVERGLFARAQRERRRRDERWIGRAFGFVDHRLPNDAEALFTVFAFERGELFVERCARSAVEARILDDGDRRSSRAPRRVFARDGHGAFIVGPRRVDLLQVRALLLALAITIARVVV